MKTKPHKKRKYNTEHINAKKLLTKALEIEKNNVVQELKQLDSDYNKEFTILSERHELILKLERRIKDKKFTLKT